MSLYNLEYLIFVYRCRDVILKRMKSDSDIMKLQLPKRIQAYLKVDKEEQNQNITEPEEQVASYNKNNSITHFRQSLYSCADSHEIWSFHKTPSNPPFLEL